MAQKEAPISLAVLLRTGGPQSHQRLESIRSTWARDLEEGALTIMEPDERCTQKYGDNHAQGLTCLEATSEARLMNRTDFAWLLVVDDDTFVFADRIRGTLHNMDPSTSEAYGAPYCGKCGEGRKGFCGGGGYLLSRQSLLKMASSTEAPISSEAGEAFVQHMMTGPDGDWCDVRFGCVAQDMGLKLVGVKGIYGNGIVEPQDMDKVDVAEETKVVELNSQDPPLVFHKVRSDAHMQRLHQEYRAEREASRMAGTEVAYSADGAEDSVSPMWAFAE